MNRYNLKGITKILGLISLLFTTQLYPLYAQTDTIKNILSIHQKETKEVYPRVIGYVSFIIPWVTINKTSTTTEFQKATTIGFPVGINVLYNKRFGFSYEFVPLIKSQKSSGKEGTSKTNNLVFDPGPIFRFKKFNLITRLAFETQGRYGLTPVINKVYARTKVIDYWLSLSLPTRFGNNSPASVGLNLQVGFTFK